MFKARLFIQIILTALILCIIHNNRIERAETWEPLEIRKMTGEEMFISTVLIPIPLIIICLIPDENL